MLEEEGYRNVINFNKDNCKVMNCCWIYPRHQYPLAANSLKSILAEDNLDFLVDTKLNL